MAYSDNFPQRPVFMADFANGGRIDPRATFSREDSPINTGNAPASAVHYWSNEKHLSSENLLTDSNGFPAYATNNVVTPSASGTFIDGTDAFVVTETTANGYHFINSTSGQISSGTSYTSTVFVKAGTASSMQLAYAAPVFGTGVYANYDLSTPTNAPVPGADATATSTGLSDGWVKITLTGTATGSGSYPLLYLVFNNDDINSARLPTYTPASAKDFSVWEANVSTIGEKVLNQTSGSIHRQYASTLKSVSTAGQPRFEYGIDGQSAGTSLGCLIESQATSLVSYSESFSNQTVNSCTLTEGAAVGPTGTLNANLLVPTASGTVVRNVNLDDGNAISHTSGNNYAFSIYAKAAGYNYLQWVGGAYFGYTYCNFDLSNGTVGGKSGSVTGSVESVGNGFYRLTVIAPATATNNTNSKGIWAVVTSSTAARNEQFTGNAYSGVLLTMAQCELGSHSSSYIASNSGAAAGTTRAADSLSVDAADIGYTGGPLTIVGEVGGGYGASAIADLRNSSGSSDNYFLIWKASAAAVDSSAFAVYSKESGTLQTTQNITGSGGATTVAVRMNTNNIASCADGGAVTTDTSAVIPDGLNKLWIGNAFNGYQLNSNLKRFALYNEALSDTNLQALTS